MYRSVLLYISITIGYFSQNVKNEVSSAIPDLLQDCYTSQVDLLQRQPLTIQMFLETIRKIELNNTNTIDARILATSMLHSVLLDGIRRSPEIAGDSFIIPYRASGEEFYKYQLVAGYLTSGESLLFPAETLTTPELCFLHTMVSNTVDPWERGDESNTCSYESSLPFELDTVAERPRISSCPIKKGTVSTKWGSVSIGRVVTAAASGFQKATVSLARLEEAIDPATSGRNALLTNRNYVDNVWVSTVAGDLANVILKQARNTLEFGTKGFWNDTLLPRVYYLQSTNWAMTESDILGGIDGLAIADHLESGDVTNLRLSQLIDMYYSKRIVPKYGEYHVTNRSKALNKLLDETDLEDQVVSAATLLQKIGIYDTKLTSEQIKNLANIATEKFKTIAGNITRTYDVVETLREVTLKSSLEIVLILDESYNSYEALQLIEGLTEVAQVSYYGSKLGVINGETGNWITNVTSDLFRIYADLQRADDWPSSMNLARALESVIFYYQKRASMDCLTERTKPSARIVLIASRKGYLTDNDLASSLRAFSSIKQSNPETSFILLTSSESKASFAGLTRHFWDNDYVLTPAGSMHSLIQDVSKAFSDIPGNIINFYCTQSRIHLEDYITPNVTTVYEIRKEYTMAAPITTKFSRAVSHGNLVVCAHKDGSRSNEICKDITVNDEISFDSADLCASENGCNLEFSISVNTTEISCIENGCRYPDQVRLEIIWQRSSGCRIRMTHLSYLLVLSMIVNWLINF